VPPAAFAKAAAGQTVRLCAISEVKGIEALAPRAPLAFAADPVTIVYGLNGAGKSGYIGILNGIFKGRPEEWVKRIVAVGGDKVDVAGDIILVNGQAEQFHHRILTTGATLPLAHLTVPPSDIFIAGDNRGVSEDSRYVGTFPASSIRGKVVAIYAPISRIGPVPNP